MFTVYRFQKKKLGELKNVQRHNLREQETPNADPARTGSNTRIGAQDFQQAVKNRCRAAGVKITEKRVAAVEHLVTASPEFFAGKSGDEIGRWSNHVLAYFRTKYGAENIVAVDLHMDEKTPHLHIIHVPLTRLKGVKVKSEKTGKVVSEFVETDKLRLNADALIGGSKANATKLQDEFALHMQQLYPELARGISKKNREAQYQRVQDWYSNIEKTGQQKIEKILNRLNEIENTAGAGILGKIKKLDVINQTKEKADRFDDVMEYAKTELRPELISVFEQLKVLQDDNKRLRMNEAHSAQRIRDLEQSATIKKIESLESQVNDLAKKNEEIQQDKLRYKLKFEAAEQEIQGLKSENKSLSDRLASLQADANKRLKESIDQAVERTKNEMQDEIRYATERAENAITARFESEYGGLSKNYDLVLNRLVSIEQKYPGSINEAGGWINLNKLARTEEQAERIGAMALTRQTRKPSGPKFG